nr:hypothetical protein CFP56_56034 [Quercus suber]
MGSFTQAIKNLLKRGKKDKYTSAAPLSKSTEHKSSSNLPSQDDLPPSLPAIQSSSIFTADKPLPPTHESSPAQPQPDDVKPVAHDAEDDSPIVGGTPQVRNPDTVKEPEQDEQGHLTPDGEPLAQNNHRHSVAVSAIEEDDRDESLPKVNGAADASLAAAPEAAAAAALPSEPTTATTNATYATNANRENIDPAATNTKEVGLSAEATDATAPSHVLPDSLVTKPAFSTADEGKIAVLHEPPPPISNVKTAPGMSATSGPLEDFPEDYMRSTSLSSMTDHLTRPSRGPPRYPASSKPNTMLAGRVQHRWGGSTTDTQKANFRSGKKKTTDKQENSGARRF